MPCLGLHLMLRQAAQLRVKRSVQPYVELAQSAGWTAFAHAIYTLHE